MSAWRQAESALDANDARLSALAAHVDALEERAVPTLSHAHATQCVSESVLLTACLRTQSSADLTALQSEHGVMCSDALARYRACIAKASAAPNN